MTRGIGGTIADVKRGPGQGAGDTAATPVIRRRCGLPVTHRTASARPVSVVVWLLAAGTLGWLLAANDTNTAVRAAPWLFLMCWFVYTSQWRPCLRVDDSGFEVINGLRDHRIPFGKVEDIEVRYTTVIWASGKNTWAWALRPADRLRIGIPPRQRREESSVQQPSKQRTHQPAGDENRTRCHRRRMA